MAEEHDGTEQLGRRDFLKGLGVAAAGAAVGCDDPVERITLEEFREKNPDYAWVGTQDRQGIYQFGGLEDKLEYVELPRGGDFHPADFTGTSPKGIGAEDVDLRGTTFDARYNDFTDFNADGTRLGGAWMPDADMRNMTLTRDTSFFDHEYGGAYLAGSHAEHQLFYGVDLRGVEASGAHWQGAQVDGSTQTIGLNLAHADVTGMNLYDLTDQNLAGILNLDLAVGVDAASFDRWAELTHYYAKHEAAEEPAKSWVQRHEEREASKPTERGV